MEIKQEQEERRGGEASYTRSWGGKNKLPFATVQSVFRNKILKQVILMKNIK